MLLTVRVTTLTDSTQELSGVNPSLSVADLKLLYEGKTRVAAVQQTLWFPVPEGTTDAQPASAFKWWEKALKGESAKPKALLDAMGAHPLVKGIDSQTLGGLAALQTGIDVEQGGALQCFLILDLKAGTKSWKLKRKATWKRAKADGSMTYKLLIAIVCVALVSTTVGLILWRAMDRGIEGDPIKDHCDPTLYTGVDACNPGAEHTNHA